MDHFFSVNKCGGSYIIINDPYTPVCLPNKVKNMDAKVFNLITGVNEKRFLVQHESYKYKCGFCKELVHWSFCKDDYLWNQVHRISTVMRHVNLMNI